MEYVPIWARDFVREGVRKGRKQGIEKTKKETVLKMLDDNLPLNKISRYTGLSIDEIKKLSMEK
jgi:predicted transposase/invertase (TIGR01784 family)